VAGAANATAALRRTLKFGDDTTMSHSMEKNPDYKKEKIILLPG
jgi:hypothetical protein